jgi:hypothetical protein
MYCGSGPCLPAGEGSGALRVLWLQILPPYQEGSDATTASPTAPCGLRASIIKKNLAGLPMQLGSHIFEACTHVSKTPDISAIMGLQNIRACSTFNAYKMHRQVATVPLQCQSTRQGSAMPQTVRSVVDDKTGHAPYH